VKKNTAKKKGGTFPRPEAKGKVRLPEKSSRTEISKRGATISQAEMGVAFGGRKQSGGDPV